MGSWWGTAIIAAEILRLTVLRFVTVNCQSKSKAPFSDTRVKFIVASNFPGGGLPYERDGDARRKIIIKTLKETNLGEAQALFDP